MNTRENQNSRELLRRTNVRLARSVWGPLLNRGLEAALRSYSEQLQMSIARGDLLLISGRWYVTHSGLLGLANRKHCRGIQVTTVPEYCDPSCSRWAFKAVVFTTDTCKGFVGFGDADPSNVSELVRGAEMRVAETRAVNRALRKAYGIGICSVEELGSSSGPLPPAADSQKPVRTTATNGNGHRPLRDRLWLLIRQHHLDPTLVKAYAADFCDVTELRLATREQVATFIKHLAEYVQSDREGLQCQLASYAPKPVCPAPATTTGATSGAEQEKEAGAA